MSSSISGASERKARAGKLSLLHTADRAWQPSRVCCVLRESAHDRPDRRGEAQGGEAWPDLAAWSLRVISTCRTASVLAAFPLSTSAATQSRCQSFDDVLVLGFSAR